MQALVSVIIPNHNYGRYLSQTINSVLNQTYRFFEIVVVDNGSTDDSRKILESFGDKIQVIYQENLGQAKARNNGILKSKGKLLALLDADDYWEPNKLEIQIPLLNRETEFVYSASRQFKNDTGETVNIIVPEFKGDCRMAFVENPVRSIVPGGESSALFTRNLFDRVGKFNSKLESASGRDFFRRCSTYTLFGASEVCAVNYRIHDRNMSKNFRKMMQDQFSALDLLFKDPEWDFAHKHNRGSMRKLICSHMKTSLRERHTGALIDTLLRSTQILSQYALCKETVGEKKFC
jgi:glycosyltransferase involved in cell wall biosynthesis